MRRSGFFVALALSAAVATPVMAQMDVEDQINTRQSAFTFAGWNMGKIMDKNDNTKLKPEFFDKQETEN
ncbi:hypothetical protein [Marinobacter sp.]|uniref:hypothetical protein n=1 Tax=Marinobacter sp. TaxID=50741 RepID=UPI003A93F9CD